ncbi:Stromal cell-derived factor 2, partial [Ophiophagus hannah]
LLNTRHNVRLHSHEVKYGSGEEKRRRLQLPEYPAWEGGAGGVSLFQIGLLLNGEALLPMKRRFDGSIMNGACRERRA